MKTKYLVTSLIGLIFFSGCAHQNLNKCNNNSYYELGECKEALVSKTGIVKEINNEKIIISLEDNTLITIDNEKALKIGEEVKIFIKK